jgi:hypothetical protein
MSRKDRRVARQVPEQKDARTPPSPATATVEFFPGFERTVKGKTAPTSGVGVIRRSYNEAGELVNEA